MHWSQTGLFFVVYICSSWDIKVDCQGAHTVAAHSSWERINTVYANFLVWIEAHEILRLRNPKVFLALAVM